MYAPNSSEHFSKIIWLPRIEYNRLAIQQPESEVNVSVTYLHQTKDTCNKWIGRENPHKK